MINAKFLNQRIIVGGSSIQPLNPEVPFRVTAIDDHRAWVTSENANPNSVEMINDKISIGCRWIIWLHAEIMIFLIIGFSGNFQLRLAAWAIRTSASNRFILPLPMIISVVSLHFCQWYRIQFPGSRKTHRLSDLSIVHHKVYSLNVKCRSINWSLKFFPMKQRI